MSQIMSKSRLYFDFQMDVYFEFLYEVCPQHDRDNKTLVVECLAFHLDTHVNKLEQLHCLRENAGLKYEDSVDLFSAFIT